MGVPGTNLKYSVRRSPDTSPGPRFSEVRSLCVTQKHLLIACAFKTTLSKQPQPHPPTDSIQWAQFFACLQTESDLHGYQVPISGKLQSCVAGAGGRDLGLVCREGRRGADRAFSAPHFPDFSLCISGPGWFENGMFLVAQARFPLIRGWDTFVALSKYKVAALSRHPRDPCYGTHVSGGENRRSLKPALFLSVSVEAAGRAGVSPGRRSQGLPGSLPGLPRVARPCLQGGR